MIKSEFKLSFMPDWIELENVYNTAYNFFSAFSFNSEYINMFTMITCELVENSIKYGDFHKHKKVEVFVKIFQKKIMIIVRNPVGESSEPYLHELDKTIQRVRGFQDPYEAYIERMREISMEPFDNDKSGLGIVRISYEGHATLDFFINEEKILNVSAVSFIK